MATRSATRLARLARLSRVPSVQNRPTDTQRRDVAVLWFLSAAPASAQAFTLDFLSSPVSHRSARRDELTFSTTQRLALKPAITETRRRARPRERTAPFVQLLVRRLMR